MSPVSDHLSQQGEADVMELSYSLARAFKRAGWTVIGVEEVGSVRDPK